MMLKKAQTRIIYIKFVFFFLAPIAGQAHWLVGNIKKNLDIFGKGDYQRYRFPLYRPECAIKKFNLEILSQISLHIKIRTGKMKQNED